MKTDEYSNDELEQNKSRTMGHIAHLRSSSNQLKHLMRKAMVIPQRWLRTKIIMTFWELNGTLLKLHIHTRSLLKMTQEVSIERFLKLRQCIFAISLLSPIWKGHGLLSAKNALWYFDWNAPVVLEKIFNFRECIFNILLLFPLEKGVSLLESPLPMDALFQRLY